MSATMPLAPAKPTLAALALAVLALVLVGSVAVVAWGRDLAVILVMLTLDFCDIDFLSLVTKKV